MGANASMWKGATGAAIGKSMAFQSMAPGKSMKTMRTMKSMKSFAPARGMPVGPATRSGMAGWMS